ncbi:hypothetical protein N2152v2_009610 [Parachlorella kessleri]
MWRCQPGGLRWADAVRLFCSGVEVREGRKGSEGFPPRRTRWHLAGVLLAQGYVARSAFKLLEIQEKHKIIPPGGRVLDLGCHPGAWLQVACKSLGPPSRGGLVIGVDIQETKKPDKYCDDRVMIVHADARNLEADFWLQHCPQGLDAVLSDMCHWTHGNSVVDAYKSLELARCAWTVATGGEAAEAADPNLPFSRGVLKPGGSLVMKLLQREDESEPLGGLPEQPLAKAKSARAVKKLRPQQPEKATKRRKVVFKEPPGARTLQDIHAAAAGAVQIDVASAEEAIVDTFGEGDSAAGSEQLRRKAAAPARRPLDGKLNGSPAWDIVRKAGGPVAVESKQQLPRVAADCDSHSSGAAAEAAQPQEDQVVDLTGCCSDDPHASPPTRRTATERQPNLTTPSPLVPLSHKRPCKLQQQHQQHPLAAPAGTIDGSVLSAPHNLPSICDVIQELSRREAEARRVALATERDLTLSEREAAVIGSFLGDIAREAHQEAVAQRHAAATLRAEAERLQRELVLAGDGLVAAEQETKAARRAEDVLLAKIDMLRGQLLASKAAQAAAWEAHKLSAEGTARREAEEARAGERAAQAEATAARAAAQAARSEAAAARAAAKQAPRGKGAGGAAAAPASHAAGAPSSSCGAGQPPPAASVDKTLATLAKVHAIQAWRLASQQHPQALDLEQCHKLLLFLTGLPSNSEITQKQARAALAGLHSDKMAQLLGATAAWGPHGQERCRKLLTEAFQKVNNAKEALLSAGWLED